MSSTDVTGGSLVGSVTIGADGRGLIPVSLAADATTEGAETLTVTVAGKSASITVNDTSLTPAPTPRAMTLTVNQDSGPDFTGTAVNDTYSALPTTLGTGDSLNGGEGNDTLNLTANLTADVSLAGFSLTSIENINVNLADGNAAAAHAVTLNMANAGAAAVTLSGLAATTQADGLVLNNLAAGSSLAMTNATNVNLTANFVAAATTGTANAVSVALNGVAATAAADSILTIGAGFETLNVSTAGSASTLGDIVSGSTRLNITGDQNLTVRQALDASLRTIDASTYTGRLSVVISEPTEATNTNPLFDAADLVVTGGSGNDTIDASAVTNPDREIHINAGAGDDVVIIGQVLANASATNAGDILNGGDGLDTLVADVDLVDAAAGFTGTTALTGVTGFEILRLNGFAGAGADIVNVSNISSDIRTVQVSTAVGAQALTVNFAAGTSSVNIGPTAATLAGSTLTVSAAGTGTTDALTINNANAATGTNQIGNNATAIATTGFETVTLNTGSYATATAQLVNTINVGTNALVLTGSNGLTTTAVTGVITARTIDAGTMTGVLTMNVSAAVGVTTITGGSGNDVLVASGGAAGAGVTINGGGGNDNITGGAGNDILNGDDGNDTITTGAGNDTVNGGAGNDTIIFAGNLNGLDRVDGGEGTDTIEVTNASLLTLQGLTISEANTFNSNFKNVEVLRVTDVLDTTGDRFDLGYLNGISTVRLATVNDAQTIAGFNSGNTLQLTVTPGAAVIPVLNGAAAGAADVFNVSLINTIGAADNFDDLTLANIETINITTSESTANAADRGATIGLTVSQTTVANGGSGAAQTVNVSGTESLTIDTAIAVGTINASGMTVAAATDAGLTMVTAFTATTAIPGQTITGSGKVDVLRGSSGADVINAGAGNDTIHGSTGADSIDGGAGTDTYSTVAAQIAANIQGAGSGESTGMAINLGATAITAAAINAAMGGGVGLSGASTSLAAGSAQYVFNTQSNFHATTTDTLTSIENITLAGNGNNFVMGSAGNNVIVGGTGVDIIDGGAGNDTITGGAGADVLTGGLGADTFVFAAGDSGVPTATNFDRITDFASASDIIDFAVDMTITAGAVDAGNTVASISAAGLASFAAAASTTALRIVAAEAGIAANGNAAAGQVVLFQGAGDDAANAYIFISDGVDGVDANDVLIQLVGVNTATAAFDAIVLAGGNLTLG